MSNSSDNFEQWFSEEVEGKTRKKKEEEKETYSQEQARKRHETTAEEEARQKEHDNFWNAKREREQAEANYRRTYEKAEQERKRSEYNARRGPKKQREEEGHQQPQQAKKEHQPQNEYTYTTVEAPSSLHPPKKTPSSVKTFWVIAAGIILALLFSTQIIDKLNLGSIQTKPEARHAEMWIDGKKVDHYVNAARPIPEGGERLSDALKRNKKCPLAVMMNEQKAQREAEAKRQQTFVSFPLNRGVTNIQREKGHVTIGQSVTVSMDENTEEKHPSWDQDEHRIRAKQYTPKKQ